MMKSKFRLVKRRIEPYLMILPAMVFLFTFSIYPMGNLVYLSFTNWQVITPDLRFVGFSNYQELFKSRDFIKALANTGTYTASMVILLLVLALITAVWLSKSNPLDRFVQSTIFTPHIISLVSVSMVWMWLMDYRVGFLNMILNAFGFPSLKWLDSSKTAMLSIVIVSTWKSLGYYTLVLISSLKSIPESIYEAAALDNASKFKVFYKITLPMLSPQLFFLLIVITMGSFKVFDTVRIMTNGGPAGSTEVLAYFIYQQAFSNMRIGYAAAGGTVLLLILIIMTVFYFKTLSKKIHYQ
jgi:sn-glycerol 3-phosphate transport system permease protein